MGFANLDDDMVDATASSVKTLTQPETHPKGFSGWLLGFLASMLVPISFYATLSLWTLQDGGLSTMPLFTFAVLALFLTATVAFGLMLAKNPEGIAASKSFFVLNVCAWLAWSILGKTVAPALVAATLHGIGSWIYLSRSARVRNTYGV